MSEKDVKMKPTPTPKTPSVKGNSKIKVKSKEAIVSTAKDAKNVMKDALVKKAVESKLGTDTQERQPQKADTEAAESVENAAYVTADTAYHKGKTYAQNKIKEHRAKVKTREETENINQPEKQEINNSEPNTHIEDVKTPDNEPKVNDDQVKTSDNAPKTREV